MAKPPQIGFRVSPELQESFRTKVELEGSDMTKVLVRLINQYLADDQSEAFSSPTPSQTTLPSASHSSPFENVQSSHRIDNLERLVMSMLDMTTLANRITSLEIRFADAIKLLERHLVLAHQSQEVSTFNSQYSNAQANPVNEGAIQSRLTEVESRLASQQQSLVSHVEQVLTGLLAATKAQLADQLIQQSKQACELQRTIVDQQTEYKEAWVKIESLLLGQVEQCAAQLTVLNQVATELQKQQDQASNLNHLPKSLIQKTSSLSEPCANRTSENKTSEVLIESNETSQTNANSFKQAEKTDVTECQKMQPLINAEMEAEEGYIVINGVRKRLLFPSEALDVVKRKAPKYKGDIESLRKLTMLKDMKDLQQLGLGAIPELKGRGRRGKPWYYEL